MGLKYYVSLIIKKFHLYEDLWNEKHIKGGYNNVMNTIIEIAKDDETISVKDMEEIVFTYETYMERYWHLVK